MSSKANARVAPPPIFLFPARIFFPVGGPPAPRSAHAPRRRPPRTGQAAVFGGDRSLLDERLQPAVDLADPVAGDVLGQVDDVRADVAECARAGPLLVEAPRQRRLRIGDPVLQVLR